MKLRLEIVPRYGTKIGIVWKEIDLDDIHDEETIGHIRLANEFEEKLWMRMIAQSEILQTQLKKELENEIS